MADEQTHKYIKNLANSLGISQQKCLAQIIDEKIHRDKLESQRASRQRKAEDIKDLDIPSTLSQINQKLEKIEKRENPRDTIVSFFKTQEKNILNPMKTDVMDIQEKINVLVEEIKKIQ